MGTWGGKKGEWERRLGRGDGGAKTPSGRREDYTDDAA